MLQTTVFVSVIVPVPDRSPAAGWRSQSRPTADDDIGDGGSTVGLSMSNHDRDSAPGIAGDCCELQNSNLPYSFNPAPPDDSTPAVCLPERHRSQGEDDDEPLQTAG